MAERGRLYRLWLKKSPKNASPMKIVAAAFAVFAYYGFKQIGVLMKRNQVDPGTKLHIWVLQCIVPISSAFQALYYSINTVKKIRGLAEK